MSISIRRKPLGRRVHEVYWEVCCGKSNLPRKCWKTDIERNLKKKKKKKKGPKKNKDRSETESSKLVKKAGNTVCLGNTSTQVDLANLQGDSQVKSYLPPYTVAGWGCYWSATTCFAFLFKSFSLEHPIERKRRALKHYVPYICEKKPLYLRLVKTHNISGCQSPPRWPILYTKALWTSPQ